MITITIIIIIFISLIFIRAHSGRNDSIDSCNRGLSFRVTIFYKRFASNICNFHVSYICSNGKIFKLCCSLERNGIHRSLSFNRGSNKHDSTNGFAVFDTRFRFLFRVRRSIGSSDVFGR